MAASSAAKFIATGSLQVRVYLIRMRFHVFRFCFCKCWWLLLFKHAIFLDCCRLIGPSKNSMTSQPEPQRVKPSGEFCRLWGSRDHHARHHNGPIIIPSYKLLNFLQIPLWNFFVIGLKDIVSEDIMKPWLIMMIRRIPRANLQMCCTRWERVHQPLGAAGTSPGALHTPTGAAGYKAACSLA